MDLRALALMGAIASITTGCPSFVKAPGPGFSAVPVPDGKAVVYFYRPAQKIMSDYPLFMSIPESANNCFRLESGGYTAYVADPGKLVVAGAMVSYIRLPLELKAGEEKFVEVDIRDDNAVLTEVPAPEARTKIAPTRGIETCSPDEVKKE